MAIPIRQVTCRVVVQTRRRGEQFRGRNLEWNGIASPIAAGRCKIVRRFNATRIPHVCVMVYKQWVFRTSIQSGPSAKWFADFSSGVGSDDSTSIRVRVPSTVDHAPVEPVAVHVAEEPRGSGALPA